MKKLPLISRSQHASILSGEPSQSQRDSGIIPSNDAKNASLPRKVVYREGGRHDLQEHLMVMESDRTSPMLRSIQSHQALLNH